MTGETGATDPRNVLAWASQHVTELSQKQIGAVLNLAGIPADASSRTPVLSEGQLTAATEPLPSWPAGFKKGPTFQPVDHAALQGRIDKIR